MQQLIQLFTQTIKDLYGIDFPVFFQNAKKGQGHLSFVSTMKIAKDIKKNGKEVAKEIADKIGANESVAKFEIFEPGFLNIYLSDKALIQGLQEKNYSKNDKTIVVDYGAENIAKYMSVGHLRSNIIGKAIVNIYEKLGWNVIKDNHLGDYGTQFGKLIYAYKKWGDDKLIDADSIEELNKLYVRFHDEADKDKSIEDFGREEFKKLEQGDKENKKIWQKFVDYSLKEFQEMYNILGSKFDTMLGESFFLPMLPEIIKELDDKIGKIGEGGAKIVELEGMPPMMYQKGDGTSLYATRDLATVKYRMNTYHPQRIAYVVGNDQSLHFRQFFKAAEMMGWLGKTELSHVRFGLVSLPEGKMSTRKGRVIKMRELVETGIEETRKMIEAKEAFHEFTLEEKEQLIKAIAVGAIKFNDLFQDREGDIVFTWEKALSLEGASGPYMQYAHARTCGIIRKVCHCEERSNPDYVIASEAKQSSVLNEVEQRIEENNENTVQQGGNNNSQKLRFNLQDGTSVFYGISTFVQDKERELAFHLGQYYDILEKAAQDYKPHYIARFVYDLSQIFNSFYQVCPVLNEENIDIKNMRIYLVKKTQEILKEGLELLGIKALEKM